MTKLEAASKQLNVPRSQRFDCSAMITDAQG
jgi:hypothetical protein